MIKAFATFLKELGGSPSTPCGRFCSPTSRESLCIYDHGDLESVGMSSLFDFLLNHREELLRLANLLCQIPP